MTGDRVAPDWITEIEVLGAPQDTNGSDFPQEASNTRESERIRKFFIATRKEIRIPEKRQERLRRVFQL